MLCQLALPRVSLCCRQGRREGDATARHSFAQSSLGRHKAAQRRRLHVGRQPRPEHSGDAVGDAVGAQRSRSLGGHRQLYGK